MHNLSTPNSHAGIFMPARVFQYQSSVKFAGTFPTSIPFNGQLKRLKFTRSFRKNPSISHRTIASSRNSASSSSAQSDNADATSECDFVTRVLKENPSQIEPRYLIGNKLYTLKEKQDLEKKSSDGGIAEVLKKLKLMTLREKKSGVEAGVRSDAVYLKDILREYKGKLYVPEQIFGTNLSEEEEFDRDFESLPKLGFEDLQKYVESDKVKLLTVKEDSGVSYGMKKEFIVELKEIPGVKSLQRTKW